MLRLLFPYGFRTSLVYFRLWLNGRGFYTNSPSQPYPLFGVESISYPPANAQQQPFNGASFMREEASKVTGGHLVGRKNRNWPPTKAVPQNSDAQWLWEKKGILFCLVEFSEGPFPQKKEKGRHWATGRTQFAEAVLSCARPPSIKQAARFDGTPEDRTPRRRSNQTTQSGRPGPRPKKRPPGRTSMTAMLPAETRATLRGLAGCASPPPPRHPHPI